MKIVIYSNGNKTAALVNGETFQSASIRERPNHSGWAVRIAFAAIDKPIVYVYDDLESAETALGRLQEELLDEQSDRVHLDSVLEPGKRWSR